MKDTLHPLAYASGVAVAGKFRSQSLVHLKVMARFTQGINYANDQTASDEPDTTADTEPGRTTQTDRHEDFGQPPAAFSA